MLITSHDSGYSNTGLQGATNGTYNPVGVRLHTVNGVYQVCLNLLYVNKIEYIFTCYLLIRVCIYYELCLCFGFVCDEGFLLNRF